MTITFEHNHLREGHFPKEYVESLSYSPTVNITPTDNPFVYTVNVTFNIDGDEHDEANLAFEFGKLIGMYISSKML